MIVAFTSCEKSEDISAPTPKNTDGQLHIYKIVVETYDLDTITGEFKNTPENPAPTITIEGTVADKQVKSNGNTISFDLNKGESYFLIIKASRSTWFKTYTYVNGKKVKYTSGSCPGLSYITFDTRR